MEFRKKSSDLSFSDINKKILKILTQNLQRQESYVTLDFTSYNCNYNLYLGGGVSSFFQGWLPSLTKGFAQNDSTSFFFWKTSYYEVIEGSGDTQKCLQCS